MAAKTLAASSLAMAVAASSSSARLTPSISFTHFSSKPSFPPSSLSLRSKPHPKPLRFSSKPSISAALSTGDTLPDSTFSYFDSSDELKTVTVADLTKGKKAIFFAVPGAFTPTCSQKHLPGFVEKSAELKSKGIDTIACISVNDAFVMKAWKKDLKVGDEVMMLSDGNGNFTKAIGAQLDLSDQPVGLGVRSRRYALLADDGVVKVFNLEEGGSFTFSGAEDMLKSL